MRESVTYLLFFILLAFLVMVLVIGYLHVPDNPVEEVDPDVLIYEGARPQYPDNHPQPSSDNMDVNQTEAIATIYRDRVLRRYNVWHYLEVTPIDSYYFSQTLNLPEENNYSMPVFYHRSYDLDEEYLIDMMAWSFPEVDLADMSVDMDPPSKKDPDVIVYPEEIDYPYILVENETCTIEFTAYGSIHYQLKGQPRSWPAVYRHNETELLRALTFAEAFVEDHGGLPRDAGDPSYVIWTSEDHGTYYNVKWYRNLLGRSIESPDRHQIRVRANASTGRIVSFYWHWPDLGRYALLNELPSANETLVDHGFEINRTIWLGGWGGWPGARYYRSWDLVYLMPDFMDPYVNETLEGIHYYIPYWELTDNEGGKWYVPLVNSRSMKGPPG